MSSGNKESHKIKLEKELNLDSDFSPPTLEEWKATVEESLKGASFENLVTQTNECIDLQPIYTKKDIENLPYLDQKPGFAIICGAQFQVATWVIRGKSARRFPSAWPSPLMKR